MNTTKVRHIAPNIKEGERQIFRQIAQQAASLLDDITVMDYLQQRREVTEELRNLMELLNHIDSPNHNHYGQQA